MTDPIKQVEAFIINGVTLKPLSIVPLPESGSYRRYFRITSDKGQVSGSTQQ